MKKKLLFILSATALSLGSIAQERDPKLIPCATFDAMELAFKADPSLKAKYELQQSILEGEYALELDKFNSTSKVAATVYTVPVVFHIMGNQNITDQTFVNIINYINNDFAKTGSDVATINPTFASLYVDSEIRFALAKRDPTGKCTNGIIRHDSDNPTWSQSAPAYNYSGTGTNRWPVNQYMNVYIVDCISGPSSPCPPVGSYIGGYTYLPGGAPSTAADAIVMLKSQLAQFDPKDSRTLSHEIGHWLNLSHVFGNTNNPQFDPSNMPTSPVTCSTDGVTDTPPTGGYFSICTTSTLDCSSPPNIENIMDYSSCPKMFTQGQTTRMRTALASTVAGRNNLWSSTNMTATGLAPGYTCTPVASFEDNKLANCAGGTITYTSTSQVGNSGSVIWNFEGGTPATSTATSQVVTYATPGTFSVSLTATNSIGSNTLNKLSYVAISNGTVGAQVPVMYDFEGATLPSDLIIRNANASTVTWAQRTAGGATLTAKSIYLNNFASSNIGGHLDVLETPIYNFSNTSNLTFSYYFAYAKRAATQADTFKIQYSLDCGGTWSNVPGALSASQMATASGGTLATVFNPTSTQWIKKTLISTLLSALNNKPSVKFRFYFRVDPSKTSANNMYLDQINITGTISTVTGISELEKDMELAIYPNPTASSSIVDFNIESGKKVKISVMDLTGRVLEESVKTSGNDGHISHTINSNNNLASGVYIVTIDVNNQRISKKVIIE
ncbi:MAG: M43 family zinc metalloprotease [Bacteroidota bacterium]